jgi:hypothetical protein
MLSYGFSLQNSRLQDQIRVALWVPLSSFPYQIRVVSLVEVFDSSHGRRRFESWYLLYIFPREVIDFTTMALLQTEIYAACMSNEQSSHMT